MVDDELCQLADLDYRVRHGERMVQDWKWALTPPKRAPENCICSRSDVQRTYKPS